MQSKCGSPVADKKICSENNDYNKVIGNNNLEKVQKIKANNYILNYQNNNVLYEKNEVDVKSVNLDFKNILKSKNTNLLS